MFCIRKLTNENTENGECCNNDCGTLWDEEVTNKQHEEYCKYR